MNLKSYFFEKKHIKARSAALLAVLIVFAVFFIYPMIFLLPKIANLSFLVTFAA